MANRKETLKKMLLENPTDNFLKYALAMEYRSSSENEKAIEILREIMFVQPSFEAIYYPLADLLTGEGRISEARQILEEGIDICKKRNLQKPLRELQSALDILDET